MMTALSGFLVQTRNLVGGKKGPRAAFYIIQPFNSPSSQVNNQERRGRVLRKMEKENGKKIRTFPIKWSKSDSNTLCGLRKCIHADSANAVSCGYALLRFIYLHKCLYFPNPNSMGMG